jgi:hypothetical protein
MKFVSVLPVDDDIDQTGRIGQVLLIAFLCEHMEEIGALSAVQMHRRICAAPVSATMVAPGDTLKVLAAIVVDVKTAWTIH